MFKDLDHIAIVVSDTEAAMKTWRDGFGMTELFCETVADGLAKKKTPPACTTSA